MQQKAIILVGNRKGAIAAAKRMNWRPIVVDVKARREQSHLAFGGTPEWAVAYVRAELDRMGVTTPVGVAAVTTGSVMAAAAVRQHYGLSGISGDVAMRCHDKLVMKKAVSAAGIPCAPWLETDDLTSADRLIEQLGLPLVLKLPISSGGRGVWICHDRGDVEKHLQGGMLAEGFVVGKEMSVETLRSGGVTLFRNFTHYLKPRWANVVPADLPENVATRVNDLAEDVHRALGVGSGISHMEVFLTDDGPVFGEIAARPPGGYLMDLIRHAYGFDPWESLLQITTGQAATVEPFPTQYAGVWLLHPGEGVVDGVVGLEQARAQPHIIEIRCKLGAGETVGRRIGTGENKGYVMATAPSLNACSDAMEQALATINMTMR